MSASEDNTIMTDGYDWSPIFSALHLLLPASYAHALAAVASSLFLASTLCKAGLARVAPPAVGSRWVVPYRIANFLALSQGFQAPAYQPGAKAVMIPAAMPRALLPRRSGWTRPRRIPGRPSRLTSPDCGTPPPPTPDRSAQSPEDAHPARDRQTLQPPLIGRLFCWRTP